MEYILTGLLLMIELTACFNVNYTFFEVKGKKVFQAILAAIYILQFSYLVWFETSIMSNMIFGFLIALAFSIFAFIGDWKQKSIITAIYLLIVYAADYLTTVILMSVYNVSSTDVFYNEILFIIVSFTSKFILFLLTYFLKKIIKNKKKGINITAIQWVELLLFTVCSLLNLYLIMDNALKADSTNVLLVFYAIAIIGCNVAIFSVISKLEEDNEIKNSNFLLEQQIKIEMENITSLVDAYANQQKFAHDFNNHLLTVQSLISQKKILDAEQYLNDLLGKKKATPLNINSGNAIVDALITQKYMTARTNNIDVQLLINDLSQLTIKNEDLVIILSNLLDNAIEAVRKSTSEHIIKVKMINELEEIIISICNTIDDSLPAKKELGQTSKKDKLNHGYGLKNVDAVVQKYGGCYSIVVENGFFKFTAVLPK